MNCNPQNERLKYAYFEFLKEADRKADSTIVGIRKAIARFEHFVGFQDFRTFNKAQALAFKKMLAGPGAGRSGEPLSKATVVSTLGALKHFLKWLALQPGYKSKINLSDIEFLNVSEKDVRAARSPRHRPCPTLEQIRTALFAMPAGSEVERRDQAVFGLAALTAMRDGALASLRLKHIDIERRLVLQNPLEVQTKFGKRIDTFFFRIGDDVEEIVERWVRFLRAEKLFGNDDPLFPRTRLVLDANQCWVADGVEPVPWSTAAPIRKIFKEAFSRVGLDYYVPHSFRNTIVQWGERQCSSVEEFKAWSQNLGHSGVLTSLTSYGHVPLHRQGELIRSAVRKREDEAAKLDEILDLLRHRQNVYSGQQAETSGQGSNDRLPEMPRSRGSK